MERQTAIICLSTTAGVVVLSLAACCMSNKDGSHSHEIVLTKNHAPGADYGTDLEKKWKVMSHRVHLKEWTDSKVYSFPDPPVMRKTEDDKPKKHQDDKAKKHQHKQDANTSDTESAKSNSDMAQSPMVHKAISAAPAEVDPSIVHIYFEPGPLGISRRGKIVSRVEANSPADRKGVRIGWAIEKINGEPFRGEILQEKKAGGYRYKITFKNDTPPTPSYWYIGQKVNCRDKGQESWKSGHIVSLAPLKVQAVFENNAYEWDEVIHSYDQDARAADPTVWMHRRNDGLEATFLRSRPDDSADVGQAQLLSDKFINAGESVTVISEKGNWSLVRSLSGKTEGYLQRHHIVPRQYVRC